ncbi:MAG: hypothetical protein NTZ78_02355 [Candidatus Aureabacteria bacterium]|nr:hypothetical protein [Candidatus Auribacterota bacterium]
MRTTLVVAVSVIFAVNLSRMAFAGSIDSSGAPSSGSGMYTLQNLYDYLTNGAALTVQTSFQEPTSGPGSTMKTTRQIGDDIKSLFDLCATTTAENVESGKPFFCTVPGIWGVQTGTLSTLPRPTATPTLTPTPSPTPTPTWGAVQCVALGGKWGATQLASPDDYGCWFMSPQGRWNCNEVCSDKELQCKSGDWNDDASCSMCRQWYPTAECVIHSSGYMPEYYSGANRCHYRNASVSHDPVTSNGGGNEYELSVCVP